VPKEISLVVILLALIAFGGLASAQTSVCDPWPLSDVALIFAGPPLYEYCVSNHGNIVHLETPLGFNHLVPGHLSEGYGLCDVGSNTAYYDYADGGATSNWLPPNVGRSYPLVIERTTSDGLWKLTQTFTAAADGSIKIKMELANHNLQGTSRKANLVRFANVNVNSNASNLFLITASSVVAGSPAGGSPGIQLRDGGKTPNTPIGLTKPDVPDPCNPTANSNAPFFTSDGAEELLYVLAVPNGGTKTANVLYRPF